MVVVESLPGPYSGVALITMIYYILPGPAAAVSLTIMITVAGPAEAVSLVQL